MKRSWSVPWRAARQAPEADPASSLVGLLRRQNNLPWPELVRGRTGDPPPHQESEHVSPACLPAIARGPSRAAAEGTWGTGVPPGCCQHHQEKRTSGPCSQHPVPATLVHMKCTHSLHSSPKRQAVQSTQGGCHSIRRDRKTMR